MTIIPTMIPAKNVELAKTVWAAQRVVRVVTVHCERWEPAEVDCEPTRHVKCVPLQEDRAEQAVDHARDSGHQIDQADQRPLRTRRRVLGDVQRDPEREREGYARRRPGDEQRADQHGGDAEVARVRLPGLCGDEGEAGLGEGLCPVLEQEYTDGDHDRQYEQSGEQEHRTEHAIRAARRLDLAARLSLERNLRRRKHVRHRDSFQLSRVLAVRSQAPAVGFLTSSALTTD
jgi:hypothetical protein